MNIPLYSALPQIESGNLPEQKAIDIGLATRDFLVNHELLKDEKKVKSRKEDKHFEIYLEDLTEKGMLVVKKGWSNYLKRFDRNLKADAFDTRILEKALAEINKKV